MKTTGMTKAQITEHARSLQRALNTKCDQCDRLDSDLDGLSIQNRRLKMKSTKLLLAVMAVVLLAVVAVVYAATEVTVTCPVNGSIVIRPVDYIAPVPGDFDGDTDVDSVDFLTWQTGYPTASGATLGDGDADGDGDVDGLDFLIWQDNYPTDALEIWAAGTYSNDITMVWANPWVDDFFTVIPDPDFAGEAVVMFMLRAGGREEEINVTVSVE